MYLNGYQNLRVWQKAMELTVEIYRLVQLLPKKETYALSDQMRRAVVSVASNIAEGQGRITAREFINFLGFSRGSLKELETQLRICELVGYMTEEEISFAMKLCDEIGKMLSNLIKKLRATI